MSDRASFNVFVDLSLFTDDDSFGHVNGTMAVPSIPSVGDAFSFGHPKSEGADELMGNVIVETIGQSESTPILMLSDVYVRTKNDAFRASRFLENCFGLFANIHDDEDLRVFMAQGKGEPR